MKQQVKNLLFLSLIFSWFPCIAQVQIEHAKEFGPFAGRMDSLKIITSNKNITIIPSGDVKGEVSGKKVSFSIPLSDSTYYVAWLEWAETDSMHILFYEESISTHGSARFIILDKRNFRQVAEENLKTFNFGEPFFKEDFMYLTGTGFVGKYNLQTKKYSWSYSDLYDRSKSAFNIINQPKFSNGRVLFTSKRHSGIIDSLIINNKNGNILEKTN